MPQPGNRLENLNTLRASNWDAAFATAFSTLVTGAFIVQFVRYLGGNDQWIGVITAVGALVGLLQIPGATWGRSYASFKKFVMPGGTIWRILYIPLVALPFLPFENSLKLWIMLVCITLASVAVQIVAPIYNDWIAELIPSNGRGWFFSRRNALAAAMGAIVSFGGGLLSDGFRKAGKESLGFSVIFAIGILFSAISLFFFLRMRDLERKHPVKGSLKESFSGMAGPFKDRQFRRVLWFFVAFVFAAGLPGNFFADFALEHLNMSMTLFQITAIAHAVGNVASIRMWGYLADKYGNKPVLAILTVGIALTPAPWLFCRPDAHTWNTLILSIGHVFAGMCWGGISVCQFNLLLATSSDQDRANYIGTGLAVQSLIGALAPLVGTQIVFFLRSENNVMLPYQVLFMSTMVLRILTLFLLAGVREEGALSIRNTLRQLSTVTPGGYRAIRSLRSGGTESQRASAIATVGETNFGVAQEEIIHALHDPVPAVRREAATTLARIGGAESVDALVHMLVDHADLIDEEIFEALGKLGDERAVEAVVPFLESPRPAVRRATAHALGRLGGPVAELKLREIAARQDDPDARRAALQSLRRLNSSNAGPEIVTALLDPLPSVRIAACEAVVSLDLKEARNLLRESLRSFDDEAGSEAAYALGAVGETEDVELILAEGHRSRSTITRRRCLLGVARLYEVEPQVYRLFILDEMSRDTVLVQMLDRSLRNDPLLRDVLELYTNDQEFAALQVLGSQGGPELAAFAALPLNESFLVASLVRANLLGTLSRSS